MAGKREADDPAAAPPDGLAQRFLRGDAAALAQVEGIAAQVVRHRGYFIPSTDQQEIVQEIVTQVWQALARPGFTVRKSVGAFVQAIACRRCVDWMRRFRPSDPIDPATPDPADPPDRTYLARERHEIGRRILRELRDACRELFRLVVLEDKSYREIAALQGRSEGALRTQMYDCLREARAIRDLLQEEKSAPE